MRVLKAPDIEKWERQCVCIDCATVVVCGVKDFTRHDDQREGCYVTWDCPTCRRSNSVSMEQIPKGVQHAVRG